MRCPRNCYPTTAKYIAGPRSFRNEEGLEYMCDCDTKETNMSDDERCDWMKKVDKLEAALKEIASLDDEGASRELDKTRPYPIFNYPDAREIARYALKELEVLCNIIPASELGPRPW